LARILQKVVLTVLQELDWCTSFAFLF